MIGGDGADVKVELSAKALIHVVISPTNRYRLTWFIWNFRKLIDLKVKYVLKF